MIRFTEEVAFRNKAFFCLISQVNRFCTKKNEIVNTPKHKKKNKQPQQPQQQPQNTTKKDKGKNKTPTNKEQIEAKKLPEEIEEDDQFLPKTLNWQLIQLSAEEKKQYSYEHPCAITPLPFEVQQMGPVPELIAGFNKKYSDVTLDTFVANKVFISHLQEVIAKDLESEKSVVEQIKATPGVVDGDLYFITDGRKFNYLEEVDEELTKTKIDDLLGHAFIEKTAIKPSSYVPNEEFKVLSEDGFCFLQQWILDAVVNNVTNKYKKD